MLDTERQTGRTQFMIDQVISAVVEGQPVCRIVVAYYREIDLHIYDRVVSRLKEIGLEYHRNSHNELYVDGSKIYFHSLEDLQRGVLIGCEKYDCMFWDHYACDVLKEKFAEVRDGQETKEEED